MFPSSSFLGLRGAQLGTGLAGTVATAAVALLTSQVLMAPTHPEGGYPTDAGVPTTSLVDQSAGAPLCFMGRHHWPAGLVGPQPVCPR